MTFDNESAVAAPRSAVKAWSDEPKGAACPRRRP